MSIAYRIQGFVLEGRITRARIHGNIQMLDIEDMIARSLNFLDTQVIMRRFTANRNCDGIASKFAWNTENPICRRIYDRYVLIGEGGIYANRPMRYKGHCNIQS